MQDRGRPGLAAVGVPTSGAADVAAYELGNRLLDNDPGVAALEVTYGTARFEVQGSLTLVLTGALVPATLDGRPVPLCAPFYAGPGQVLDLRTPSAGLRSYLGVTGGIAVDPVLGSRSRDTLAGLGPEPLVAGSAVPAGQLRPGQRPPLDVAPVRTPTAGLLTLDVLPGPRADWVAEPSGLTSTTWTVSQDSDRVGLRLDGPPLRRAEHVATAELPSEGLVRGAVQVPGDGHPVLFLADHPVTGGYPVVAVLTGDAVDQAAQARPGQLLRFRPAPAGGR